MKPTTPFKATKTIYLIISAAFCIIGLIFIIHPAFSAAVIGTLCGIFLIAFGAVKIVGYFSKDMFRLAFQFDLALGILLLALGVIIIIRPDGMMNLLCIALGISMLIDGLFKIQTAIDSKRFGLPRWWLIMIFAVLTCIHGTMLVLRPAESAAILTVILGMSLLFEGILNFITVLTAVKTVNDQSPGIIETEAIVEDITNEHTEGKEAE